MGRKDSIPNDAPAPRLCCLVKWEHFQGYGFNLHSEKGKEGQFIGKIDAASPAEACGLQEGDEVIEVNGVNTSNENHKQVVQRIKAVADKVELLVVDAETAEYYKKRHIVVKGSQWNVKKMTSKRSTDDHDHETGEKSSQGHTSVDESLAFAAQSNGDDHPPPPVPRKTDLSLETISQPETSTDASDVPSESTRTEEATEAAAANLAESVDEELPPPPPSLLSDNADDSTDSPKEEETATVVARSEASASPAKVEDGDIAVKSEKTETPRIDTSLRVESGSERAQPSPAPSSGSTGTVESAKSAESAKSGEEDKFGLKLNMTAAEMKEYLKSKKRHDPRNDSMSFKQRHAIISNM